MSIHFSRDRKWPVLLVSETYLKNPFLKSLCNNMWLPGQKVHQKTSPKGLYLPPA